MTPIRTCAGCRRRRPQAELVRVVRHSDGSIAIDPTDAGRGSGRGAYVCCDARCVERALSSGALRRTLRFTGDLPDAVREGLERRIKERDG